MLTVIIALVLIVVLNVLAHQGDAKDAAVLFDDEPNVG